MPGTRAPTDYDAIIVGAGPAGCSAAFDLATGGRRVLLIDRRRFPRVKACAGGLSVKTLKALRYPVTPVVRLTARSLVVGKGLSARQTLVGRSPIAAMTVRSEFDDFCLQRTIEAGAESRTIRHVSSIEESDSGVRVTVDGTVLTAGFLVGADGANSTVRRLAGLTQPALFQGFAIEGKLTWQRSEPRPEMEFDFGAVDHGYGWLFPKDDHVNVGLYTNSPTYRPQRHELADYCMARTGRADLDEIVGAPIGLGGPDAARIATDRVLLVGDAAGLVDPLLGEGIHNAVKSGQAAAHAISAGLVSGPAHARRAFRLALGPVMADAAACARAARWFYGDLDRGYGALTWPLIGRTLMKGFACGFPIRKVKRRFFLIPFARAPKTDTLGLPASP